MYTVIRTYNHQPELAEALKKNRKEIEKIIIAGNGFVAYSIVRIPDGAVTLTTCETLDACEESTKRAGEWLRQNLSHLKIKPPVVTEGEVCVQFAKTHVGV